MAQYVFISQYPEYVVYAVLDPESPKFTQNRCQFHNGIFITDDDEIAEGLQRNDYFNKTFYLKPVEIKAEVVNPYEGELLEIYEKLKTFKRPDLIRIAEKVKGKKYVPVKKEDIIRMIIDNLHKVREHVDDLIGYSQSDKAVGEGEKS